MCHDGTDFKSQYATEVKFHGGAKGRITKSGQVDAESCRLPQSLLSPEVAWDRVVLRPAHGSWCGQCGGSVPPQSNDKAWESTDFEALASAGCSRQIHGDSTRKMYGHFCCGGDLSLVCYETLTKCALHTLSTCKGLIEFIARIPSSVCGSILSGTLQ